jgi:hypothetical protein
MGDVVALSSFEANRGLKRDDRCSNVTAEVILFTGVRYERIGNGDDSLKFKNGNAHLDFGLPVGSKS